MKKPLTNEYWVRGFFVFVEEIGFGDKQAMHGDVGYGYAALRHRVSRLLTNLTFSVHLLEEAR
ncbi:hypothetical protein D3C72_2491000 [compost metagenome]